MKALGLLLMAGGMLALLGYLAYRFFTIPGVPLVMKVAVPLILAGFLLVLGSVWAERYRASRREDFTHMDQ